MATEKDTDVKDYIRELIAEEKAKEAKAGDKADAVVGGVAGAGLGAAAGWGIGTLGVLAATAVGIAAAPVIVPLAVVGGLAYGGYKGGKKLFD